MAGGFVPMVPVLHWGLNAAETENTVQGVQSVSHTASVSRKGPYAIAAITAIAQQDTFV